MTDRATARAAFLARAGWDSAQSVPLAGDASARRYHRLTRNRDGARAVLMDAPPTRCGDQRAFVRIARHLQARGLSAPLVLAEDRDAGFVLLEDLGDDLFARLLIRDPSLENSLYSSAIDVLATLRTPPPEGLPRADPDMLTGLTDLVFTAYATNRNVTRQQEFHARFHDLLAFHTDTRPVLLLRDYHAENLIWLPDRIGIARVGLLDFQDAMAGPPAYDLVSLLQDARRDVSAATEVDMIARYLSHCGDPAEKFHATYAVIGVQRHLRILGVFARLAAEQRKHGYVDLIPRVWAHLMRDLAHPALRPVADLVRDLLPPPTTDHLQRLKGATT